jgi:hypothetical protein
MSRRNVIREDRQPNYETPEKSLLWGYKCSSKALDRFKRQDFKNARNAVYDVREAIADALFLLGFRGSIDKALVKLKEQYVGKKTENMA